MGSAYAHTSGVAIALFFGLPVLGLGGFLWLRRQMARQAVPDPPTLSLFVVFASYGILLEIAITVFGRIPWSGMHSLGVFCSVVLLAWLLPLGGFLLRKFDSLSVYHRCTHQFLRYYPLALLTASIVFLSLD
jgi:hypothetical protein